MYNISVIRRRLQSPATTITSKSAITPPMVGVWYTVWAHPVIHVACYVQMLCKVCHACIPACAMLSQNVHGVAGVVGKAGGAEAGTADNNCRPCVEKDCPAHARTFVCACTCACVHMCVKTCTHMRVQTKIRLLYLAWSTNLRNA